MDILFPLIFFGFLGAIIIVPQILRSRDRQRMFDTMKTAYEKGQPVPPELSAMLETMTRRNGREFQAMDAVIDTTDRRDLRRGVVWTSIGAGFVLMGIVFYAFLYSYGGAVETLTTFCVLGIVPLCVGIANLALYFFTRDKARV